MGWTSAAPSAAMRGVGFMQTMRMEVGSGIGNRIIGIGIGGRLGMARVVSCEGIGPWIAGGHGMGGVPGRGGDVRRKVE